MVALAFGGIYPNYRDQLEIESQIEATKQKIDTQQLLLPIYRELIDRIKKNTKQREKLPPNALPAKPKEVEQFLKVMGKIAVKNEMILKQITPDSGVYRNSNKHMGINITLIGDFFHFRQLLLQLCYIRFLHEVESIRIHTNGRNQTFNLRIILVQE